MVNTLEVTSENTGVDTGRRDFLSKWAALTAMAILWWVWLTWCKTQTDTKKIKEVSSVCEDVNFKSLMYIAGIKLIAAYEVMEYNVVKNFYNKNVNHIDVSNLIGLSVALHNIQSLIIDDDVKKRMANMSFKFDSHLFWGVNVESSIRSGFDFFAKKYPDLIPVIEEWKKR